MTDGDPEEQAILRMTSRALRRFEQLHWIATRGMRPVFRLWHYPAQGAWQSWVLFCPRPLIVERGPLVRYARWDRNSDLERLGLDPRRRPDLHPSLGVRDTEIADEALQPLMREASRLDLPVMGVVHPFTCQQVCEFGIEGYSARPTTWVVWDSPVPSWMRLIARWADFARRVFLEAEGGEGRVSDAM